MQTLKPVDTKTALGETGQRFTAIEQRLKKVPDMLQVIAFRETINND